jgi:hypothetical protein
MSSTPARRPQRHNPAAPANGFRPSSESDDRLPESTPRDPDAFAFERLTTKEFFAAKYRSDYLLPDLIAKGQPLVLAGAKKNLKTSIMIAAGIALASGTPFLGKFPVPRAVNVGLMSGESGAAVLQETAQRIAKAGGLTADQLACLHWSFQLPALGNNLHLDALERFIDDEQLEFLCLDPAYLCVPLAADAANLFAVGQYLWPLSTIGQRTGCTVGIAHHTRKNVADPFAPPELEDIAWSGFQEWARQWILLGRRERYDPEQPGRHRLWMNSGGSAGHSSLWALDIFEGSPKDIGGRRWELELLAPSTARSCAADELAERKLEQAASKERHTIIDRAERIERIMREQFSEGCTRTELCKAVGGMAGNIFADAFGILIQANKVVPKKVRVRCGPKGTQEISGFILATPGHRDNDTETGGVAV